VECGRNGGIVRSASVASPARCSNVWESLTLGSGSEAAVPLTFGSRLCKDSQTEKPRTYSEWPGTDGVGSAERCQTFVRKAQSGSVRVRS